MPRKPITVRNSGTAQSVSRAIGVPRKTLDEAMRRGDELLDVDESIDGKLHVSLASAKRWAKNRPRRGPKGKG